MYVARLAVHGISTPSNAKYPPCLAQFAYAPGKIPVEFRRFVLTIAVK
jgi:hypothetical protein